MFFSLPLKGGRITGIKPISPATSGFFYGNMANLELIRLSDALTLNAYQTPAINGAHPGEIDSSVKSQDEPAGQAWINALKTADDLRMGRRPDVGRIAKVLGAGWAEYALAKNNIEPTPQLREKYRDTFVAIDAATRKNGITTTREMAISFFDDILPELVAMNGVGDKFNNGSGLNSIEQIVSVGTTILQAEEASREGGRLRIFSQMCAHYQRDENQAHEAESFMHGLATELDPEKTKRALKPIKTITDACRKLGIPVEVITHQVTPHPDMMAAMVPSTVWGFVESKRVDEMIQTLARHEKEWPQLVYEGLGVIDNTDFVEINTTSYAISESGSESIIQEALRLSNLFGDAYTEYIRKRPSYNTQTLDIIPHWSSLSVREVRAMMEYLDSDSIDSKVFIAETAEKHEWSEEEQAIFPLLQRSLAIPGWGTLADMERFYNREETARSGMTADKWRREVDYEEEKEDLLKSATFYPELTHDEREQMSDQLLQGVDFIANLGIGARAIFNTSLYGTMGKKLAKYNSGTNLAIMWPLEEDYDRWSIDVMQKMWNVFSPRSNTNPTIPCVYPRKMLRQPFGK